MKVGQAPRATVRRCRWSKAVTAIVCLSAQMSPKALLKGPGRVHVAIRVRPALVTSRCSLASVSCEQAMTRVWHKLPHAVALASALVLLGSCADLSEFRTDLARLSEKGSIALWQMKARRAI